MSRSTFYHCLSGLALLCSLPVLAATVYKSIDENGVVTFSDTKPPEETLVEVLEIDHAQPEDSVVAQQRLEEMRATTDRMVADRMAREKHRAEMRQLDAQTAAQEAARERSDNYDTSGLYPDYYPYYYPYPVRRPWRPPHQVRPEHPIARPPLIPPADLPPGVRPLPGNNYPASLIRQGYDPKVRAALR